MSVSCCEEHRDLLLVPLQRRRVPAAEHRRRLLQHRAVAGHGRRDAGFAGHDADEQPVRVGTVRARLATLRASPRHDAAARPSGRRCDAHWRRRVAVGFSRERRCMAPEPRGWPWAPRRVFRRERRPAKQFRLSGRMSQSAYGHRWGRTFVCHFVGRCAQHQPHRRSALDLVACRCFSGDGRVCFTLAHAAFKRLFGVYSSCSSGAAPQAGNPATPGSAGRRG